MPEIWIHNSPLKASANEIWERGPQGKLFYLYKQNKGSVAEYTNPISEYHSTARLMGWNKLKRESLWNWNYIPTISILYTHLPKDCRQEITR